MESIKGLIVRYFSQKIKVLANRNGYIRPWFLVELKDGLYSCNIAINFLTDMRGDDYRVDLYDIRFMFHNGSIELLSNCIPNREINEILKKASKSGDYDIGYKNGK